MQFASDLAEFGNAPALIDASSALTYFELAERVDAAVDRLGKERRLLFLECSNSVESIVDYLAALAGGHVALLVPQGEAAVAAELRAVYSEDGVELHPELALLLSTSGSTGSPKLVRLSGENLQSNAESIADYLAICGSDRAVTTLPMHYCYGLSVINSHLARGAALVLTDLSVVDRCFWRLMHERRVSSFAGVPHTFELLERVGFKAMDLPDLRYITQAGGRLAPELVRDYSELAARRGFEFFVMYGQTEATARMAYLPPELASTNPQAIGVPISGGRFRIDASSGELIYSGPNVMLGYAESASDLALGPCVSELHTGDLGRLNSDGLYEVTGRKSRFLKLFGLRIDLQRCEQLLAEYGITAHCAGDDRRLVVAVESEQDVRDVRDIAARQFSIPTGAITAVSIAEAPRLLNGKVDYAAITELGDRAAIGRQDLPELFAEVLGVEPGDVTAQSTFVSLGGDSLSYVEMSIALEGLLGELPAGWHVMPIAELGEATPKRRRLPGVRRIETSVMLRAVAIILIVGSHAGLFKVIGSAHVLIAVAGFNFARFMLGSDDRAERIRRQTKSVLRIAIPSIAWIAFAYVALTDQYTVADILLIDAIVGPGHWTPQWHFWFIEVLLYMVVMLSALLAIPAAAQAERRWPFGFAAALLTWGLVLRFDLVELGLTNTKPVFWLFALGWGAARARTIPQRVLISAVALMTVPNFFGDPTREAVITSGLLLLVWVSTVPWPALLSRLTSVLAAASLYIYLTHWQVFRHLLDQPLLGVACSLGVGVAYWMVATRALNGLFTWFDSHERRPTLIRRVNPGQAGA